MTPERGCRSRSWKPSVVKSMPRLRRSWGVSTPADRDLVCPRCQGEDWRAQQTGAVAIFGRWLRGMRPWRAQLWTCTGCDHRAGTARAAEWRLHGRSRWWLAAGAPWRLLRVLLSLRRRRPPPGAYLAVGAVAALVRWALARNRPNSGPATAAARGSGVGMAGLWLASLGTVRRRPLHRLRRQMADAADPGRVSRRHRQETLERLQRSALPVYDLLPAWGGARMVGGHGYDHVEGQLTSVTLQTVGTTPEGQNMEFRVTTRSRPLHPVERELLVERLLTDERRLSLSDAPEAFLDRERSVKATARELAARDWPAVTIDVDGRPVELRHHAVRDDAWVAVGTVGEETIALQARGIAPDRVELVGVSSLDPYLTGAGAAPG